MSDKIKKLVQKFKNIQSRYNTDHDGEVEEEKSLERLFRPVTKAVKEESATIDSDISKAVELFSGNVEKQLSSINEIKEPILKNFLTIEDIKDQRAVEGNVLSKITNLGPLAVKYLSMRDDKTFGLQFNPDSLKYTFGGEEVNFDNNDILFADLKLPGTVGLWELLTMKEPNIEFVNGNAKLVNVSAMDKKYYLYMVSTTKIHLTPTGRPRSSKSQKWVLVIGPWFHRTKQTTKSRSKSGGSKTADSSDIFEDALNTTAGIFDRNVTTKRGGSKGDGLLEFNFLDPNPEVLISKLYTLILNLQSGHTNVLFNEIFAIMEKLYKDKFICSSGYEAFLKYVDKKLRN